MFVLLWILILIHFQQTSSGYIEIVEKSGCESCRLLLTCRHLSSIIAILEVEFIPVQTNETLGNASITPTPFPPMHPRDALNKRCSGVNHCSFILTEDCAGSENLGLGNITIKYACVTEDRIKKYCNSEIVLPTKFTTGISEGFIHNPGYPRFYSGQRECHWKITAPSEQKIRLTVLDVALIVDNVNSEEECTDTLEVIDTNQVIHSACRQEHPPAEIISGSDSVDVVLTSSQIINPRRGILIHYIAVGCPTPLPPQNGYLVSRNDDLAVFHCCLGYHFPDTGTRTKSLRCLGAYWNISLPLLDCEKSTLPQTNQTQEIIIKPRKGQIMAAELIAPALIILALFLINGGVLFLIYKAKKKQAQENINDEELGVLAMRT